MNVEKTAVSADDMTLINKFSRAELSENDVYSFKMVCCDTNIDRDGEAFSVNALNKLAELFVGKTVITDHKPSAENQIARIYKTHVEENNGVSRLIAWAYIPKNSGCDDFITLIDTGIVKEVSVGCSVKQCTCSICGKELNFCQHRKFKDYDGKTCYGILDDITDAYEVSFVAVPAQKEAGVTKSFKTYEKAQLELKLKFADTASNTASIEVSDGENTTTLHAFQDNLTFFKAFLRADFKKIDDSAFLNGVLTV